MAKAVGTDHTMSLELKRFLLNSYGAPAHRRVKEIPGHDSFRIDDPKQAAEGSTPWRIHVAVTGLDRFLLHLTNTVMNDDIERLVKSRGGEVSTESSQCQMRVALECTDFAFVLQLSELILHPVASGQVHSDQRDETTCSRMAESLSRFAGLLKQYAVQTRGMEKTRPDGLFAF
jgi:hypothetical protein